jgi:PTH2 family peptidyl-tRNA hydrolase
VTTKLVVVVRTDLPMSVGKVAAQVAHAAVASALARQGTPDFDAWLADGQPKVVLAIDTLDELTDIVAEAVAAGLPYELVQDAGRTEIDEGTTTCAAIGPAPIARVDRVTGHLPLR